MTAFRRKPQTNPIRSQLKALLIGIAAYDAALLALLALIVWGAQ